MADLLAEHATALTVAGAESELTDDNTPRFLFYEFPTATEIFSDPDPPGRYPWPVTLTGDDDIDAVPAAELAETATYRGQLGGSGVRVHDFEAMGAGDGAVFRVYSCASSATCCGSVVSSTTWKRRSPAGSRMVTSSPSRAPRNPRPRGESSEMWPFSKSMRSPATTV